MKSYPNDIESKLGFDKIKEELAALCLSELGRKHVRNFTPQYQAVSIQKLLSQTREFIELLDSGAPFPQSNYLDIRVPLKKSQPGGAFLGETEFFDIKLFIHTVLDIITSLKSRGDDYRELTALYEKVELDPQLAGELDHKIDERGQLRDHASSALMAIRATLSRSETRARTAVNKAMKSAAANGYVPDGANITLRDGRMVIPVLAEHKRHVRGFIHDESATGQTVYMEPAEGLEINNELRALRHAERREVTRILTELTDEVRCNTEPLERAIHFLGIIDSLRAKALFAARYEAICPEVSAEPVLHWVEARHPVLETTLKQQGRRIIPLTISLNHEQRILLISGPNAGGKSVCLKTIGLLQYMLQTGVPVPVAEGSKFGVFAGLFMDIGDEQSIENDLSTYSSHLTNMKFFLEHATRDTLFLIDELGAGTEPQFGGAIAEVILHELNRKHAYGAITTHYANLKKKADRLDGVVNGAMKYNVKKLEPIYTLEIGSPGSSFALEIAGKIGLNKEMLDKAKKIAGVSQVQFDRMINELDLEKAEIKTLRKSLERKDKRLAAAIKDYEEIKAYMEAEKPRIIEQAKVEAAMIIKQSNKQVEQTIRAIKKAEADKKQTRQARQKLKDYESELHAAQPAAAPKTPPAKAAFEVGDRVKMSNSDAVGEILNIQGKKAEIAIGTVRSRAALSDLTKIPSSQTQKLRHERVQRISGIDLSARLSSFSPNLDIRGSRTGEAVAKVESFVDEALLLGFEKVKILHGKGHGVLRELVRNTLRDNHRVGRIADEYIEMGGSGITVVELA